MRFASIVAAVVLALPAQGNATGIEGAWRPEPNPFKSAAAVTFGDETFTAHVGGYTYGGEYRADDAGLSFKDVIVIEGALDRSEIQSPQAWRFWRDLADTIISSNRYRVDGDVLTLEGPRGTVHLRRASRDLPTSVR